MKAVKVCMERDGVAANIEENACPNVLLSNYLEEALHIFKEYLSAGMFFGAYIILLYKHVYFCGYRNKPTA